MGRLALQPREVRSRTLEGLVPEPQAPLHSPTVPFSAGWATL